MKIVYCGSSEFSVAVLAGLRERGVVPVLVVTTVDKPRDRGYSVKGTPVKDYACRHGLAWRSPRSLKDAFFLEELKSLAPDIILVASFGRLIPETMLEIPSRLPLCVHPSLLPCYRGAAPLQRALLNGEKESGVTLFKINRQIDSGPLLFQKKISIGEEDDIFSLSRKLENLSVESCLDCLTLIDSGAYQLIPQDETRASYAPKIEKEEGHINWSCPARDIVNLVRAVTKGPTAVTLFRGRRIQIIAAVVEEGKAGAAAGEVARVGKNDFSVACSRDRLRIITVKPEGKKEMSAASFICGHRITVGQRLE